MALYLINGRLGKTGLEIAKKDQEAKIVMIQDGVYIDTSFTGIKEIFYLEEDVKKRGLEEKIGSEKLISYDQLIDFIVNDKVYNFI